MIENLKKCTKCGKELPATTEYFHKAKGGVYGLRGECKTCKKEIDKKYHKKNKEKYLINVKNWQKRNPEKVKQYCKKSSIKNIELFRTANFKYNLRKKYNLTMENYINLYNSQNGVCAICGNIETTKRKGDIKGNCRLSIDHDHKNGRVRGLLCRKCNSLLGYARGNIFILIKTIEYINYHKNLR